MFANEFRFFGVGMVMGGTRGRVEAEGGGEGRGGEFELVEVGGGRGGGG